MEPENQQDEVARSLIRCGAKRDSALEKEMRASIWAIAGADMVTASRDEKLDKFIRERRLEPRFTDSFEAPRVGASGGESPVKIPQNRLLRLTEREFSMLARGEATVE